MSKYKVQIDLLTRYVKSSKGFDSWFGLCHECRLDGIFDIQIVNNMFKLWDGFSGDLAYPVKSPAKNTTSLDYYMLSRGHMHDRRTKCGKARLSLAKHCLKYLQDLENKNG